MDDEPLTEFVPIRYETSDTPHIDIPAWQRIPGTDLIPLPFGRVIPCFKSPDYPLVPVI